MWDAAVTALVEKYGSEAEAVDRIMNMSKEEIRKTAHNSGLMTKNTATIGG